MNPSRRRALVFDLDGTLIDSAPDLQAALNRVLAGIGRRSLELDEVTRMIGDGMVKLVDRALRATGGLPEGETVDDLANWVGRFVDEYKGHGVDLTYAYPGVPETLKRLKDEGYAVGVCTNKPHFAAGEVLEGLGLMPFIDAYLGGGEIPEPQRKPHPDHAREVLRRLGAAAAEGVMIGDLLNDILCGRGAGMPVVFCTYGYAETVPGDPAPDAVIDRFEDLPDVLLRLN